MPRLLVTGGGEQGLDGRGCERFYPDVVDAFAGLSRGEREELRRDYDQSGYCGAAGYTAGN